MTLHALTGYIKYKRKAKNRHGVHSPFVYKFIENGLRKKDVAPEGLPECARHAPPATKRVLAKVIHYFSNGAMNERLQCYCFDMPYEDLLDKQQYLAKAGNAIILLNIHATKQHTAQWLQLREKAPVTMSIDLYRIGILLFKTEFKECQHFIVKP